MNRPTLSIVADCRGCKYINKTFHRVPITGKYWCNYGSHVDPNLANSTRTPDACPLLPAAKAAFVAGLTVTPGVVIDGREV